MREFQTLRIDVVDDVAVVAVNRPRQRNALDDVAIRELHELLDLTGDDDATAGLIFRGASEGVFISGADIAQLRDRQLISGLQGRTQRLFSELQSFPKPTIAALTGHALGGGCEFALACDLRVAAEDARIGLPEVGLGIVPGAGGTQRLARHVGLGRAIEMILTGRLLSADEAQRTGLVAEVASQEKVLDRALEIMRGILSKAPLAIRLAKAIVRASLDTDEGTGLLIERLSQALLYTTEDKVEGIDAFLERRPADFKGR